MKACWKRRLPQVLLQRSKVGEITEPRTANQTCHWSQRCGWEVVHLTRYNTGLASSDFSLVGLRKKRIRLTSDLEETLLWSSLSPPGYNTLTHFSSTLGGTRRGTMVGKNICMSLVWLWVSGVYHVPYIHPCQNKFLGIRLFTLLNSFVFTVHD